MPSKCPELQSSWNHPLLPGLMEKWSSKKLDPGAKKVCDHWFRGRKGRWGYSRIEQTPFPTVSAPSPTQSFQVSPCGGSRVFTALDPRVFRRLFFILSTPFPRVLTPERRSLRGHLAKPQGRVNRLLKNDAPEELGIESKSLISNRLGGWLYCAGNKLLTNCNE